MDISNPEKTSSAEPPRVTVILATYKRPGPLAWTLTSILKQRFSEVPVRLRLVILNNDPQGKEVVAKVVAQLVAKVGAGTWEIKLHHRDPPLYALDNIYNGVLEFSDEGDVVFLSGDDDLLLAGSLAARIGMFQQNPAMEVLLAHTGSGLFFTSGDSEQNTRAYFFGARLEQPAEPVPPYPAQATDLSRLGYILITCQAYRHTARFRKILAETRTLMDSLPCGGDEKRSMLPQFLPILYAKDGGLYATGTMACVRGQLASNLLAGQTGHSAWSGGFSNLAAWYLLACTELKTEAGLERMRQQFKEVTLQAIFFSLGDNKFQELARHLDLKNACRTTAGLRAVLVGLRNYAAQRLRLNALRVRLRRWFSPGESWTDVFAHF